MIKIGILGGGQLGRMLLQAANNYPVEVHVLENSKNCPAYNFCRHFTQGDINGYDDVYAFGKTVDALTIEIENVNLEALISLEKEGLPIFPNTNALTIIRNKARQKQFYKDNEIPTSDFVLTGKASEINDHAHLLPAVHKLASGGYDGKGVQILQSMQDASLAFEGEAVLEKLVDINKEIAISIAVSASGEYAIYKPVDMVFDQRLNLLSHQISPAEIEDKIFWKIEAIALRLVKALKSPGLFAIEFFVDKQGEVLVNETAPRVHNSGHHTIEACYSSQFDMLLRVILGYPLGNPDPILPAAIVNLIGSDDSGTPVYEGLNDVLKMDNVFVHLYGKKETRPGRKMGHVTIMSKEKQELLHKISQVKQLLSVTAQ